MTTTIFHQDYMQAQRLRAQRVRELIDTTFGQPGYDQTQRVKAMQILAGNDRPGHTKTALRVLANLYDTTADLTEENRALRAMLASIGRQIEAYFAENP